MSNTTRVSLAIVSSCLAASCLNVVWEDGTTGRAEPLDPLAWADSCEVEAEDAVGTRSCAGENFGIVGVGGCAKACNPRLGYPTVEQGVVVTGGLVEAVVALCVDAPGSPLIANEGHPFEGRLCCHDMVPVEDEVCDLGCVQTSQGARCATCDDSALDGFEPLGADCGDTGAEVPTATCDSYCTAFVAACADEPVAQYEDHDACLVLCQDLALGADGDTQGDSLACRAHHASEAANPGLSAGHCPSAQLAASGECS